MFKSHVKLFPYIVIMIIMQQCYKVELFEGWTEVNESDQMNVKSKLNCETNKLIEKLLCNNKPIVNINEVLKFIDSQIYKILLIKEEQWYLNNKFSKRYVFILI